MRFSMILEMVDRLSAPAKRARAGVTGLRGSIRQMAQQVRGAAGDLRRGERSLSDIARSARRVAASGLGRLFGRASADARRFGRDLAVVERRLKLADRAGLAMGRSLRGVAGIAGGFLKNSALAGGAAAVGAGSFALFDLFRTAGQFEQYQVQLEGIEGSVNAARQSMNWVQDFTKRTPFEIDQVMEAFIALKAYGIDPTNGSLEALGDTSAGMSKPIMQAVEALADAMTGEFERLKEFGIRASKEGNRVAFTFRKNGKDIRREADFTGSAIEAALVGIFNERFGGGMERQAGTLFGIISNLKDMWTSFLLLVAQAGIFDVVKKDLRALLANVEELAKNGELKRWAEDISDRLQKAWKWGEEFVTETDWDAVVQDLKDIAEAVRILADAILELKRMKDDFTWIGNIAGPVINPLGTGLREFNRLRNGGASGGRPPSAPPRSPARLPSESSLFARMPRQSAVSLEGALKIDVSSSRDLNVRATPFQGPGKALPIEVRTGRTMRSAA